MSYITAILSAASAIGGGIYANRAANKQASFVRKVGQLEAESSFRQSMRVIGAQRAAFAKSGVDASTGSSLDVLGDSVAEAKLNALMIRMERRMQSASLKTEGNKAIARGSEVGTKTIISAGGKLAKQQGLFGQ